MTQSSTSEHPFRMPNLRGQLPQVKLTPTQEKQWDDTRTALLWHCPAFAHIFYTMMDKTGSKYVALFTDSPEIPIAATDGSNMIINPEPFFKLSLNERLFVAAHEIMHCILNHCSMGWMWQQRGKIAYEDGTELPYDGKLMNIAMDLVINDILIESNVGSFLKGGYHDRSVATAKDSCTEAYRKIFDDSQKNGGKTTVSGQGFDIHVAPGSSTNEDAAQAVGNRSQSQWDMAVREAQQSARLQGKLPAGLDRVLGEILAPKVDWRDKIEALFARKAGSGSWDFKRADRRLITRDIFAPSRSGYGCGPVVVGVDTSGSIGHKELDMFMAEMAGILDDCTPEALYIVWCDAEIGRVDEAEEASDLYTIRAKGAPGGGGTSFIPVFDWIEENNIVPSALVYMTDGMGSFPPSEPSYPVIWANIYDGAKYPFGDVVDIPKQN